MNYQKHSLFKSKDTSSSLFWFLFEPVG